MYPQVPHGDPVDPNPGSGYPMFDPRAGAPPYPAPVPPLAYLHPVSPPRPGAVTTACLLGCLLAVLLVTAGAVLLVAAAAQSLTGGFGAGGSATTQLGLAALGNLVVAALLISGARSFTAGRPRGRAALLAGDLLCVLASVCWIGFTGAQTGIVAWALLFSGLAVAGAVGASRADSVRWVGGPFEQGGPSHRRR